MVTNNSGIGVSHVVGDRFRQAEPAALSLVNMYGRDFDCGMLDDLLEGAQQGRSGSVVLCGEAGIGKSALLRYAAEQAGDARILEVRGVEAESGMPFAGLHALLYPVRSYLSSLSEASAMLSAPRWGWPVVGFPAGSWLPPLSSSSSALWPRSNRFFA